MNKENTNENKSLLSNEDYKTNDDGLDHLDNNHNNKLDDKIDNNDINQKEVSFLIYKS